MTLAESKATARKRAPSKRALATKARVLDAAEAIFAARGFDGATIRDIAARAGEPVGTIHHHGGGKEALFQQTVARRAESLSRLRLDALEGHKNSGTLTLETLLASFMRPFFDLSQLNPGWQDYARLVAFVSADDRWRAIAAECFDPTAEVFVTEFVNLVPTASRAKVAECFVFSVSAMLALLTSQQRIAALGGTSKAGDPDQIDRLVKFCAAGLSA